MRKFKHKQTGRIAKQFDKDDYNIVRPKTEKTIETTFRGLPKELIEGSNDWEEIKEEENRIDKMLFRIHNLGTLYTTEKAKELVEDYLPKITDDMIEKMYNDYFDIQYKGLDKKHYMKIIKQNLPKDLLANPE